ncbi:MAG TPA: MoaD/ThiS family protein [Gemmataceae bacterium]|nr:MoaD/ThiS family protein [Gemmataceae bacterium]
MPTVWIPALLRHLTGERESVLATGVTLGEIIESMDSQHPGIKTRLVQGNDLRPGIAVVIDGQVSREGLGAAVPQNSEVHFIPSVSGGG